MKFSLIKEIFYKQESFFHNQGSFPQTKIFTPSQNFSGNKDHKGSLKAIILDPFITKSYAKIFLTL